MAGNVYYAKGKQGGLQLAVTTSRNTETGSRSNVGLQFDPCFTLHSSRVLIYVENRLGLKW